MTNRFASPPGASRLHAVMVLLAFASVAYHLWLVTAGLIPNLISRPPHIVAVLPFIFVFAQTPVSGVQRGVDVALCVGGLAACAYVLINHQMLDEQYGRLLGATQYAIAWGLILLALEMARRQVKWAMPTTAAIALLHGLFGQYLPGELGHAGIPAASFLGALTITEGGLWGTLTGTSAEVVAVFVILGAVMGAGEGGKGFMAAAVALAGRLRAGAAKVAVLSSALFGSISGSASANVASTGAITLPTMKRLGYPPALAAAVEAVASSGCQIMPPVMGAGAFIMAELLRTTYSAVLMAALLPVLLFFWGALLLTGVACLILGMEVSTTAAYVICVAVAGPALMEMGLEPLHAHLFIFWFALLSTITPPVCGAVFIAAGMAGAPWLKVACTR